MASHKLPCAPNTVLFQHLNAGKLSSCLTAATALGVLPDVATGRGSDRMP